MTSNDRIIRRVTAYQNISQFKHTIELSFLYHRKHNNTRGEGNAIYPKAGKFSSVVSVTNDNDEYRQSGWWYTTQTTIIYFILIIALGKRWPTIILRTPSVDRTFAPIRMIETMLEFHVANHNYRTISGLRDCRWRITNVLLSELL